MIPIIPAAHFTPAQRTAVDLIVLHSAETPEKPFAARAVAEWFAGADAPQASAHFVVDAAEVYQCVLETDIAWGAPGANHNGIHIEHAGRADQNASQWADLYSSAMLQMSIALCADICRRWSIPAVFVGAIGLKQGRRGITRHMDVSAAFRKSTHQDPGPGFPIEDFCSRVAARLKLAVAK